MKKSTFWQRRPIVASTATLAVLAATSLGSFAQVDGKPGVDSSPSDLRSPEGTDASGAVVDPTPAASIATPQPAPVDPAAVQATPVDENDPPAAPGSGVALFDIVAASDDFTTLVTALKAAELETALKESGPYTLFAPNNAAFAALPEGVLRTLLLPDNKEVLADILSFHVLPQRLGSADLKPGSFKTIAGTPAALVAGAEGIASIAGAPIVRTDINGKNGVLHVVSRLMLPPSVSIEDYAATTETTTTTTTTVVEDPAAPIAPDSPETVITESEVEVEVELPEE